ncbi:trypsin-like cysteine/serine peptidase domain-containing protein [Globomyces pollinis-pini]|nr:trypsin-like cysteine/serine peptidase domain-containing protein [Globomyces pollinis-pini]KAJ2994811.1 hypothetical protein HDV02_001310 [Globomyces sp. JEL0801]
MKFFTTALFASTALAFPADKPIVNGTPVGSPDVYPWLVAIRRVGYPGWCGGTLISPTKIMTAAHCTVNDGSLFPQNEFTVFAHRYDINKSAASEKAATYTVTKMTPHPKYVNVDQGYDVAVWDLKLVDGTPPTTVVKLDDGTLTQSGQSLIVAGWGDRYNGAQQGSPIMLEVTLPVTPSTTCYRYYPELKSITTAFCAGNTNGKDSCQGDSGGPLFSKNEDGSVTVAGVVSYGGACGSGPGVYSKVSNLSSWVRSV